MLFLSWVYGDYSCAQGFQRCCCTSAVPGDTTERGPVTLGSPSTDGLLISMKRLQLDYFEAKVCQQDMDP